MNAALTKLAEHALRWVLWVYCGFILLLWDSSKVWCWVLFEGFLIAIGIFVGVPGYYVWKAWRAASRRLRRKKQQDSP